MKTERLVIVTTEGSLPSARTEPVGPDAERLAQAFLRDTLAACLHPPVRAAVWLVSDTEVIVPESFAAVRQLPASGQSRDALLERGIAEGYRYVCFVGHRTPHLPTGFLQEAFGRLTPSAVTGAGVEAVWGPTDDGGFALAAFRQHFPDLLATASVAEAETRSQARGVGYHLLPRWYRVNTGEDLTRLAQDMRRDVIYIPYTAKVLADQGL